MGSLEKVSGRAISDGFLNFFGSFKTRNPSESAELDLVRLDFRS